MRIDSLIVEKNKTAPFLQEQERFYPQMIGHLLRYVLDPLNLLDFREVIVVTDTIPINKKRSAIEKAVKQTLSHMLPIETTYRIFHHASKSAVSLQIVDYCNWAIFRKWESGDLRSYDLIKEGIKNEITIFKNAYDTYY